MVSQKSGSYAIVNLVKNVPGQIILTMFIFFMSK